MVAASTSYEAAAATTLLRVHRDMLTGTYDIAASAAESQYAAPPSLITR